MIDGFSVNDEVAVMKFLDGFKFDLRVLDIEAIDIQFQDRIHGIGIDGDREMDFPLGELHQDSIIDIIVDENN